MKCDERLEPNYGPN